MTAATPNRSITVVGSVNVDYVMRVPSIPLAGETLSGSGFDVTLGGKGANQAVACARLGGDTHFIACVGDDSGGKQSVAAFRHDGISIGAIKTIGGTPTGSAMIFVDDDGENCIGINAGANAHLDVSVIESCLPLIAGSDYLLMQLETPVAALTQAAAYARQNGGRVILNPAPAVDSPPAELLANVDILTPNQGEAARLAGLDINSPEDAARAARAVQALGPDTVIVTLGSEGALVLHEDVIEHIPTQSVSAVDTVAAGDTFNGALAVALAEGKTLIESVRFANVAAALAVTRRGAQDAIPQREEVLSRLDSN